jgi:mRNA interferase HicA
VKQTEFVRWLKSEGVVVKNGTGHLKAHYNGKQTIVSRHPGKDLDNRYVEMVKKQLGMK